MFELYCDGDVYRLLVGDTYIVGRSKECRIQLPTTPSVSRQHAHIAVTADRVTVTDRDSRFGTAVNDKRLNGGASQQLSDGDVVRFGNANPFTFKQRTLTAATSRLDKAVARAVAAAAKRVGIDIADKWDGSGDVDMLIVVDGTLTAKFVFAVACGGMIVTAKWIADAERTAVAQPKSPTPDPAQYQPQTAFNEQIFPPCARRGLYGGIAFVFANADAVKRNTNIVAAVGGAVIHCSDNLRLRDQLISCGATRFTCVTALEDDTTTAPSNAVIAEAEIGTLIVTARIPPTDTIPSRKRRDDEELSGADVKRLRRNDDAPTTNAITLKRPANDDGDADTAQTKRRRTAFNGADDVTDFRRVKTHRTANDTTATATPTRIAIDDSDDDNSAVQRIADSAVVLIERLRVSPSSVSAVKRFLKAATVDSPHETAFALREQTHAVTLTDVQYDAARREARIERAMEQLDGSNVAIKRFLV